MTLAIASEHVQAHVHTWGGLLWRPRFRVGGDRWFEPLAAAPWSLNDLTPELRVLPPYLARLGGAFVAAPFGGRAVPRGAQKWSACDGDARIHGFTANGEWTVAEVASDRLAITIDGPPDGAISSVRQDIRCAADQPSLEVKVHVTMRRRAAVPFGYHPVLQLPHAPGSLTLRAPFLRGHGYPVALSGSQIARGAQFSQLNAIPATRGGVVDASHFPLTCKGEDLLLLAGAAGKAVARFEEEGLDFHLGWDAELLPNLMVWRHENAEDGAPWSGKFRGLGLEPCASAFDFAASASTGENPLKAAGERTALELTPEAPLELAFRLSVELSA